MTETTFAAPRSLDEAVTLLKAAKGDALPLAGGTDLLVQLRLGTKQPRTIVDLKRIPELNEVRLDATGLKLGAAMCAAALGENAAVKQAYPGLVEAAELIGSTQIQGRASVGGNLCNGSPAADSVPALAALAATCKIIGPAGAREVPVSQFVTGPGKTVLAADEILVALRIAPRPARSADAYLRFIPRTEMDIAVVGVGVDLTLDKDGRCTHARVVLGAVGPSVIVANGAAAALVGTMLDDNALDHAAAAASAAASPIDDKRGTVDFRRHVAGVLTKRATRIAAARAAERT
ncbi:MAG: FAD binding domain-containing protein [Alphaproteobacteria bacterium]